MPDITMIKPNIATLVRRESSTLPPAALPQAALDFVNQLSEIDVDVDYVTLRFDTQTKELGLTYSDALKQQLGLANNHYTLFQGISANVDNPDAELSAALVTTSFYLDPFTVGDHPLQLPLPQVCKEVRLLAADAPQNDHLVIAVAESNWPSFQSKLYAAAQYHPDFLNTAKNINERFGFMSEPMPALPLRAFLLAHQQDNLLSEWESRYDLVYSAVLVLRYPAGKIPQESLA